LVDKISFKFEKGKSLKTKIKLYHLRFIIILSLIFFADVFISKANAIHLEAGSISISLSDSGIISHISVRGEQIPCEDSPLFSIKKMTRGDSVLFADKAHRLFFHANKWKINKAGMGALISELTLKDNTLFSSYIEIKDAAKINIDMEWLSRGSVKSFTLIAISQFDENRNEINDITPVSFRFNTRESAGDIPAKKRFSFTPSPRCRFISLSIRPSKGLDIFSCTQLSTYGIGERFFKKVKNGKISFDDDRAEFFANTPDFELSASFSAKDSFIFCRGTLTSAGEKDAAAIIRFSLPVIADNLIWHDTLSATRKIEGNETYSNTHKLGSERFFSLYPFSLISRYRKGIAYAIPPMNPRIFRTGYSSKDGYFIEFDLGMSEDTAKFPSSASFSFIIYGQDSKWGLRESADIFYSIYPDAFVKRNTKEGIWFAWLDPKNIYIPQDFGFMFDTTPDKSLYFDRYYGIDSFHYQEPYGIGIPWKNPSSRNRIPEDVPYEEILKKVESPSFTKGKVFKTADGEKNFASAAIESAMKDEYGRYYIGHYKPYMVTNPDPELPYGKLVTERVSFRQESAESDNDSKEGEYIDSVVPAWWAIKEDYHKEHFPYSDIPLTFSYETGKPVLLGVFPSYELYSEIASITKQHDSLVLANTWYPAHTFYYGLIDILGAGEYSTDQPIENFHYLRAIASEKTLSFIDRGLVEGGLSQKEIEKRFMKCLAFAVYPGALPFKKPSDYERLRPFYKKYIPLIKLISSAGWKPITYASSSHPSLNVERYGNPGDLLFFTIYNPTKKEISFAFGTDSTLFDKGKTEPLYCYDIISGAVKKFKSIGKKKIVNLSLSPQETIVIQAGTQNSIIAAKLILAGYSSQSLGSFYIEPSDENNLLKNISPQKNTKFEYDDTSPYISGVKIENEKSSDKSTFRLGAIPKVRKTDYRIDIEYTTEEKKEKRDTYISKFYCLLYSAARFLSRKSLPDITVGALITDYEGKLIKTADSTWKN